MATLTVSIPDELKKKDIFERYIKTGELSDEDWMFCERIDWHPVDELPLKEEFVKRLKEARKGTPIRFNSVDEFFETISFWGITSKVREESISTRFFCVLL
jgi:hypothetical protein